MGESKGKEEYLDTEKTSADKKISKNKLIKEIIFYVVLLILCIKIIPEYVLEKTYVDGTSMEKTLHNKNYLLTDKLTLVFDDPDRFDIVVLKPFGEDVEEDYIKRVIGLPGETIQVINDTILINGEVLKDKYKWEAMKSGGIAETPILLGKDEYFVMGDNRNDSGDSREEWIGPIKRKDICGRAFLRIWPLDEFGLIK